jgi:hypothetical protein
VAVAASLLASGHGAPVPAKLTARDVLLTAATAAAAAPDAGAGAGRYWRQEYFHGYLIASGPNSTPYVIEQRSGLSNEWLPTSSGGYTTYRSMDYTSRLPTPGAIAAWRADGSPALPRRAGQPPRVDKVPPDVFIGFTLGNEEFTTAQLRALPGSTAGLKEALINALQAKPRPGARFRYIGPTGDQGIIIQCVYLLQATPVTPGVRAAALRILATMTSIQLVGQVTDPVGRAGYGFTMPGVTGIGQLPPFGVEGNDGTPQAQERLIISASGTLLADEFVAVAPTTSFSHEMPASGAIPGPASCPPDYRMFLKLCLTRHGQQSGFTPGAPILAVPAGTITDYTVYLGSALTNDAPSPTPVPLPSSAPSPSAPSPSAPSASASPSTPSPAPSTPTPSPSQSPSPSPPTSSPAPPASSPASPPASSTPSPSPGQ